MLRSLCRSTNDEGENQVHMVGDDDEKTVDVLEDEDDDLNSQEYTVNSQAAPERP
jgi:hypothetical protein